MTTANPKEEPMILRETKHTDEIGYWVLSLFAGMHGHEIARLNRHPSPWKVIRLTDGMIDLRDTESPRRQRVIAILPNLRSWLVWLKTEGRPFFPKNHWDKAQLLRAKIVAYRNKRLNAVKARSRRVEGRELFGTARRSFIAYRLALDGVHWVDLSDQIGQSERFLRDHFGNKVSPDQARRFFSLTPDGVSFPGKPIGLLKNEPEVQLSLNNLLRPQRVPAVTSSLPAQDIKIKTSLPRRNGKLVGLERELVDHFVELAATIGVPRSYGEIYGVLYASAEPLSFTDIQERTDLSKGSISLGLHALRSFGAIRPSEGLDRRREHYVPETELRQLIAGLLKDSIQVGLTDGAKRVGAMLSRHRATGLRTEHDKVLSSRLEKLRSWHRKAGLAVPLIFNFLG